MSEKDVKRFLAGLINIKIQPASIPGFPTSIVSRGFLGWLPHHPGPSVVLMLTRVRGALRDSMKALGLCVRKD